MAAISAMLCFTGLLLFLFGLLVGFGIPAFASPRLGVSAHATGVQSGTALLVVGLVWPHLQFWDGWSALTAYGLWVSLYVLFGGLTMGAVWATGRTFPIAGGGAPARPWQERFVQTLIAVGAFGTTAAILAILTQWRWIGA
jgi:(hydroxyamino)benzene mutase